MSETMIAKVAQAMWAQKEELTPPPRVSWENAPPDEREFMFKIARAAIAAVRTPTEGMVREAQGLGTDYEIEPGVPVTWPPAPETLWKAMIDAALKE